MDDEFERFKSLYKKFINGTRWLSRQMQDGVDTKQDNKEFVLSVVEPMDAMRATFTKEEKDYWSKVEKGVKEFEGTVVSNSPRAGYVLPKGKVVQCIVRIP